MVARLRRKRTTNASVELVDKIYLFQNNIIYFICQLVSATNVVSGMGLKSKIGNFLRLLEKKIKCSNIK